MELRFVDPKTLKDNPANPRLTPADLAEDRQLAMNIKMVGLLQPPVVREIDGELVLLAGHRRRRAAIKAGLKLIPVNVRAIDETTDDLAAASENIVRAAMTEPDQWAAVKRIRASHRIKDADLCRALMLTPAQLKRLELLANLHPPMLDAINRRMAPTTQQLQIIAAASVEDQSVVWGRQFRTASGASVDDAGGDEDECPFGDGETEEEFEPMDVVAGANGADPADQLWPVGIDATPDWRTMAQALSRRRFFARDARFDDAQAAAAGVVWTQDLFAEGGADARFTEDATAFAAAQEAWLADRVAKGCEVFGTTTWGTVELPEGYRTVSQWMASEPDDRVGFYLHQEALTINEVTYRVRAATGGTGDVSSSAPSDTVPVVRPDLSSSGHLIIGTRRTMALHAALDAAGDIADPWDLVAGLLLALTGNNVSVQGDSSDYYRRTSTVRESAAYAIAPEGDVVRDPAVLRPAALSVLKAMSSCASKGQVASGISALILGRLFNADAFLPSFADEEYLKTYSKPGITKLVQGENILPRNTGKEMRAALLSHIGSARWVPEVASFDAGVTPWQDEARAAEARTGGVDDVDDADDDMAECAADDDVDEVPLRLDLETQAAEPEVSASEPDTTGPTAAEAAAFMRDHFEVIVVR